MKDKIFILLLVCLVFACPSVSRGDTVETVTIGDTVVGKFVTQLTFSGSDVVLVFEDGTTQTADMSLVSIDLTYDDGGTDPSGIVTVSADAAADTRVYSISGQYVGTSTDGLAKGLYIVNGKKIIIR